MNGNFTAAEKEIFQEKVNAANWRTLRFFSLVWLPLSIVNFFAQWMTGATWVRYLATAGLLVYFLVMYVRSRPVKPKYPERSTELVYYVQIVPMIIAVLLGTVLDPDHEAFTVFVMIALMPVLILDERWKVLSWITLWAVIFLFFSFICKSRELFYFDLIHTIEFYVVSIAVADSVISHRLESVSNYVKALPSTTDMLTGLHNMPRFLEIAQEKREKTAEPLSVAYFNLAGLKKYNRIYGYPAGSKLLKDTANVLAGTFGKENCARFSDDHFAAIATSSYLSEKIEGVMEELASLGKSCSYYAGVCELSGSDQLELACDRARSAAGYLKKRNDNRHIQFYDKAFQEAEANRQFIQFHLDEAIEKGWIEAWYQPIFRTATKEVCNEEALARWNDPVRGLISPADFIPVLEENRMLYKLDLAMVRNVVRDMKTRTDAGMRLVPISINFSRYDFEALDMVKAICEIVDKANISRRLIVIEITESAILGRTKLIGEAIDRFHEEGFQVWMDDFGSGWSSLGLLTSFHFDMIKLDMQFASQLTGRNGAVVRHIIEMAKDIGINVLAEGVETEEEFEIFREFGCEKQQGFLFNTANPLPVILELVRTGRARTFEAQREEEKKEP